MADLEEFEPAVYATDVDPSVLAAAAQVTDESRAPVLEDPLDGPVTLPVGFRRVATTRDHGTKFEDVRKAWVRELNGEDEEKIARAQMKGDFASWLETVLKCGVERLGDEPPTLEDIRSLVVGDQQYLLVEIARSTFGDELEYENFTCPHCFEVFNVSLSLGDDIPVRRLDRIEDASFEVALRGDQVASMTLPTGAMNEHLANLETGAETNTVIIAQAVEEIRGPKGTVRISGDLDAARKIGSRDRKTLVNAVGERMVGPQYNEVKFTHEVDACGKEIRLEVTPADMFREM